MAAFSFRVDANTVNVEKYLSGIQRDLRPKVVVPAINKTATKVKTEVVRKISKDTSVKQKKLRAQIKLVKARKGTAKTKTRNFARVDASDAKTINLIEFVTPGKRRVNYFNKVVGKGKKKKYRSKGVVAKVGKKRKVYDKTFIATSQSGQLKVFRRKAGSKRNKIYQVSGARPGAYFKKPEMHEFMRGVAEHQFPIELQRKINHVLRKK